MKYIPSIAFEEMSGTAKGVTAAKTRGRKYIRNKGYSSGGRSTAFQASVKSIFKQLATGWKSLANEQILAWNSLALSQAGRSILGSSAKITGANLYMRLNYWIVYCGGAALTNPPTLVGVDAPADATLSLTASAMTFRLASVPADVTNLKLVVLASAPQSNGITRAYSKAAAFDTPAAPSTDAIDIKAAYEAKNGAPNAAAPKVFFKWFYVNTATGEKSGEKMAVVTLSAGA